METGNEATAKSPPARSSPSMAATVQNAADLFSSIKSLFNATAQSLSAPISLANVNELSAVLALNAAAKSGDLQNFLNFGSVSKTNGLSSTNANAQRIAIDGITDIRSVPLPG